MFRLSMIFCMAVSCYNFRMFTVKMSLVLSEIAFSRELRSILRVSRSISINLSLSPYCWRDNTLSTKIERER